MSWNAWVQHNGTHLIRWITRRRHVGRVLLMAGVAIMVAALSSGFSLSLTRETVRGRLIGWITTGEGLPLELTRFAFWVALGLVVIGVVLMVAHAVIDVRHAQRSAAIAVELRGLIDTSDRPLLKAIPKRLPGQRLDANVDIRSNMSTGALNHALKALEGLPDTIRRLRGQRERKDVQLVVGGVLQVPLLFYAGVLLDDEGVITPLDWDRKAGSWRELNDVDDGVRFSVTDLATLPAGTDRVVLAVSASYATDAAAIATTFSMRPVVSMTLPRPLPDTLWSGIKQADLTAQFLEVLAELGNRGVRSVDLVLAASSSLALRMGRAYDRRNLPELRCYQYQKDAKPPYPWCVEIIGLHDAQVCELS